MNLELKRNIESKFSLENLGEGKPWAQGEN